MYEEFYGLREKPFSILPDPEFLYWGRAHSMAFAMLEYGILNQAGFTVITGEVGCGKTTLVRHLLNNIGDNITVGLISNTEDDPRELLQWVLHSFDQPFEGTSHVANYAALQRFCETQHANGRRSALIVDEAQNLGTGALEQLRMLSNINTEKHQLLQLIVVGQPELKTLLQRPELRQFAQRVSSDFHLGPLGYREVVGYIDHRLAIAGQHSPLFSDEAIEAIYEFSKGIPRIVNILCDTALVYGFSGHAREITRGIVEDVINDKREHGVFEVDIDRSYPRNVDVLAR